jgi:WhiB family redox-sensing transcriptional regulator
MTYRHPVPADSRPPCMADPELHFPDYGHTPARTLRAKAVCAECDVIEDCLDYALAYSVVGVWGGTSVEERREIRRRRGIVPERLPLLLPRPCSREAS